MERGRERNSGGEGERTSCKEVVRDRERETGEGYGMESEEGSSREAETEVGSARETDRQERT